MCTIRTCTGCDETKPLTEFYKQKNGKHGRYALCKVCWKDKTFKHHLKRYYGISVREYDDMVAKQQGACANR